MVRREIPSLALSVLLVAPGFIAAEAAHPLRSDYDQLLEWRFCSSGLAVPASGLHWQIDTAAWHLDSGRLWLQQPTADGRISGFVFEGSGRFRMTVADRVELRQLRRFAKDPNLQALEETFDSMVVRFVGLPLLTELPDTTCTSYSKHPMARDRHDHWLTLRLSDVDARVLAALGRAEDVYVRADMRTAERGWLTYDYDAQRPEEVTIEWFNASYKLLESWLSLDRAEDRDARGRPTAILRPVVDIEHLEITADLTEFANESPQGVAKVRPMKAKIRAALRFVALTGGDRTLQLYLHPWAKVTEITDEEGARLAFARDHLGQRSSAIDRKVYDDSLVILFDQPLTARGARTLAVSYELELPGFAPGRIWYPSATYPGSGLTDRHTARLKLISRDNFAIRAMGQLEDEQLVDGRRTAVWIIDSPVKMLTFVFAKRHHEETYDVEGMPEVAAFSSLGGYLSEERIRRAGADVVRSLEFFQDLFDSRIPVERLQAALIPAAHGQAFEGLLHIGDFSTLTQQVAEQELFRSHEVAHLWWGHKVGWHGYRDQWLSEGFAEYSAMMFVEATVDKGGRYFDEMLKAFSDELTGSIESSFSQFNRPGRSLLNMRAAARIGPIGHGRRCIVGEAPTAYFSQAYKKGALVLHMLRMILRTMTGSDQAFFDTLRAFVDRYDGKHATTADFEAVLEEVVPAGWSWFFDQWVLGAEIPTYVWSHEVSRGDDGYVLRLHVEQRDVDSGFKMAIPVRVDYPGDRADTLLAVVDEPVKDFEFPLDDKPRRVIFNPDYAVLARVRKK